MPLYGHGAHGGCCDLRAFLKDNNTLPLPLANKLFCQIENGLRELHRRGVLHRDLKPANIFIDFIRSADGNLEPFAVVGDLGSARVLSEPMYPPLGEGGGGGGDMDDSCQGGADRSGAAAQARGPHKPMTQVDAVLTPNFLPPEHLAAHPTSYDASVDTWALGCIYGEMLGAVPGNGRDPQSGDNGPGGKMFRNSWVDGGDQAANENNLLAAIVKGLGPDACALPTEGYRVRAIRESVAMRHPERVGRSTLDLLKDRFPACADKEGLPTLQRLEALLRFDPAARATLWDPTDRTHHFEASAFESAQQAAARGDMEALRNHVVEEMRAW